MLVRYPATDSVPTAHQHVFALSLRATFLERGQVVASNAEMNDTRELMCPLLLMVKHDILHIPEFRVTCCHYQTVKLAT